MNDDKFSVQTLNNITLKLSENVTDKRITYIEKRVINGFDVDEIGKWIISFLTQLLSTSISDTEQEQIFKYIKTLFGYDFVGVSLSVIINNLGSC